MRDGPAPPYLPHDALMTNQIGRDRRAHSCPARPSPPHRAGRTIVSSSGDGDGVNDRIPTGSRPRTAASASTPGQHPAPAPAPARVGVAAAVLWPRGGRELWRGEPPRQRDRRTEKEKKNSPPGLGFEPTTYGMLDLNRATSLCDDAFSFSGAPQYGPRHDATKQTAAGPDKEEKK